MDTITQCSGLRGSVMLKWSYESFISIHYESEAFGYRSALLTWKNNNQL